MGKLLYIYITHKLAIKMDLDADLDDLLEIDPPRGRFATCGLRFNPRDKTHYDESLDVKKVRNMLKHLLLQLEDSH